MKGTKNLELIFLKTCLQLQSTQKKTFQKQNWGQRGNFLIHENRNENYVTIGMYYIKKYTFNDYNFDLIYSSLCLVVFLSEGTRIFHIPEACEWKGSPLWSPGCQSCTLDLSLKLEKDTFIYPWLWGCCLPLKYLCHWVFLYL